MKRGLKFWCHFCVTQFAQDGRPIKNWPRPLVGWNVSLVALDPNSLEMSIAAQCEAVQTHQKQKLDQETSQRRSVLLQWINCSSFWPEHQTNFQMRYDVLVCVEAFTSVPPPSEALQDRKDKGLNVDQKASLGAIGGARFRYQPCIYVALCSKSIIPNYIYSLHLHTSTHLSVINIHQCTSPLWHKFKKDMEILKAFWLAESRQLMDVWYVASSHCIVGILWPAKESWGTRPWSYGPIFALWLMCLCAFR